MRRLSEPLRLTTRGQTAADTARAVLALLLTAAFILTLYAGWAVGDDLRCQRLTAAGDHAGVARHCAVVGGVAWKRPVL